MFAHVLFLFRSGLNEANRAEAAIVEACNAANFTPRCQIIGDFPGQHGNLSVSAIFGTNPKPDSPSAAADAPAASGVAETPKKRKTPKSDKKKSKKNKIKIDPSSEQLKSIASLIIDAITSTSNVEQGDDGDNDDATGDGNDSEEEAGADGEDASEA